MPKFKLGDTIRLVRRAARREPYIVDMGFEQGKNYTTTKVESNYLGGLYAISDTGYRARLQGEDGGITGVGRCFEVVGEV